MQENPKSLLLLLHLLMFLLILLHTQHNPITMMFRILLFSLFRLHSFFHLEFLWNVHAFLHSWPLLDCFQPFLDPRVRGCRDTGPFSPIHPGKGAEVSDGVSGKGVVKKRGRRRKKRRARTSHRPSTALFQRLLELRDGLRGLGRGVLFRFDS